MKVTATLPQLCNDFLTKPEDAGTLLCALCLGALSPVWLGADSLPVVRCAPEAALWMLTARPPGPKGFSRHSL